MQSAIGQFAHNKWRSGFLTLMIVLLLIVDGLWPRISSHVGMLSHYNFTLIKLALLLNLIVITTRKLLVAKEGELPYKGVLLAWWIFVCYLLFDALVNLNQSSNVGTGTQLHGLESYYFWILILPLFFVLGPIMKETRLVTVVFVVSIPLELLGIAQGLLHRPLISTSIAGDHFQILSWGNTGYVRAFSLFSSPLNYGLFSLFVLMVGLASFRKGLSRRRRLFLFLLVLLAFLGCYFSKTRVVYLAGFLSMVSYLLIKRRGSGLLFIKLLPIIYLVLGVLLIIVAPHLSFANSGSDLTSKLSLDIRLSEWSHAYKVWNSNGVLSFLFGTGIVQNQHATIGAITVDNTFLAILVQSGLCGLIFSLILLSFLWVRVVNGLRAVNSPLRIAGVSLLSIWSAISLFNVVMFMTLPIITMFISEPQFGTIVLQPRRGKCTEWLTGVPLL